MFKCQKGFISNSEAQVETSELLFSVSGVFFLFFRETLQWQGKRCRLLLELKVEVI